MAWRSANDPTMALHSVASLWKRVRLCAASSPIGLTTKKNIHQLSLVVEDALFRPSHRLLPQQTTPASSSFLKGSSQCLAVLHKKQHHPPIETKSPQRTTLVDAGVVKWLTATANWGLPSTSQTLSEEPPQLLATNRQASCSSCPSPSPTPAGAWLEAEEAPRAAMWPTPASPSTSYVLQHCTSRIRRVSVSSVRLPLSSPPWRPDSPPSSRTPHPNFPRVRPPALSCTSYLHASAAGLSTHCSFASHDPPHLGHFHSPSSAIRSAARHITTSSVLCTAVPASDQPDIDVRPQPVPSIPLPHPPPPPRPTSSPSRNAIPSLPLPIPPSNRSVAHSTKPTLIVGAKSQTLLGQLGRKGQVADAPALAGPGASVDILSARERGRLRKKKDGDTSAKDKVPPADQAKALAAAGQSDVVHAVCKALRRWPGTLDVAAVSTVLMPWNGRMWPRDYVGHIIEGLRHLKLALPFFRWCQAQPWYTPLHHPYVALLAAASKELDVATMESLFKEVKEAGMKPQGIMFTHMINCYGHLALVEKAREAFYLSATEVGVTAWNCRALLFTYCQDMQMSAAESLIEKMRKKWDVPLDAAMYTMVLHMYLRDQCLTAALRHFRALRADGVKPDQAMYNIMISLCGNVKREDLVLEMLEEMTQQGLPLNGLLCSTLMHQLVRWRRLNEAIKVLTLFEANTDPASSHYQGPRNILIYSLLPMERSDLALRLLQGLIVKQFHPDAAVLNRLIVRFIHANDHTGIVDVLTYMRKAKFFPSLSTFYVLLKHLQPIMDLRTCELILQHMEIAHPAAFTLFKDLMTHPTSISDVSLSTLPPAASSSSAAVLPSEILLHDTDPVNPVSHRLPTTPPPPLPTTPPPPPADAWQPAHGSATSTPPPPSSVPVSGQGGGGDCGQLLSASEDAVDRRRQLALCEHEAFRARISKLFTEVLMYKDMASRNWFHLEGRFFEILIQFLVRCGLPFHAKMLWEDAQKHKFLFSKFVNERLGMLQLDFHGLSTATTRLALLVTLADLRAKMLMGKAPPARVALVTGWGRNSSYEGGSNVRQCVEGLLEFLDSPFQVHWRNAGQLTADGKEFRDWLIRPEMEKLLALALDRGGVFRGEGFSPRKEK